MSWEYIIEKILEYYNNNFIVISITALYNKVSMLEAKYSLQTESLGDVIVLDSPPLVDKGYIIKDDRKHSLFFQEQINNFVSKIEDNISKDNLLAMYNNLHNLNIKESDIKLIIRTIIIRILMREKIGICGGYYLPQGNKIVVYSQKGYSLVRKLFKSKSKLTKDSEITKESKITLEGIYTHELLHMSSTIRKNNKICVGFMHKYRAPYVNFNIGKGINEGYTDLLNDRIFNIKNNGGLYEIYKIISELIENIIGKDKMMNLYFNANLKDLILELSKYIEQNQVKTFIVNIDLIHKNPKKINEIIEFLFNLYDIKIRNEVLMGKITKEMGNILYDDFKFKTIKLSEIFNKWVEEKIEDPSEIFIDNNTILDEQQISLSKIHNK